MTHNKSPVRHIVAKGISVDPDIMSGNPCLSGERWPTYIAREYAQSGNSTADMITEYPWLTYEQIADALAWEFRSSGERRSIVKACLANQRKQEADD